MSDKLQVNRAVFWTSSEVILRTGLGLLISIILARLVTPEEFGLIAMLMLFTAVASLFVEGGFATALIQNQKNTYTDECTVFWFNLAAGVLATLVLMLSAPQIAGFFTEPMLTPLLRLMALNLLLSAFLTVPTAILTRKLNFETQMKASLSGMLVAGAIAVFLAFKGWGVWAIAIQTLSSTLVSGLVLWKINSWRPAMKFSWESFRRLSGFGGFVLFASLIDTISTRIYTLIIGKHYGPLELGYFYRATATKDIPQSAISSIFSRIALPVFSSQAQDSPALRESLRVALITTMAINLPIMAGLMMTADELVPILFGPNWNGAIPILKVLCGLGALWPVQQTNISVLMALGHSKLVFKIEILKKTLLITSIIMASQISMIAVAWAMLTLGLASLFVNTWCTNKLLTYGLLRQLNDIRPYVFLTLVMMTAVAGGQYVADSLIDSQSILLMFLIKFGAGVLSYGLLSYRFRLEALTFGYTFIRKVRRN